ncbi:MAG TPA: hypothetical protein VMB72_09150 [Acidimicrobiales bacterium]|nr:hypothetical protein [Acidimicrobiales bacterium]
MALVVGVGLVVGGLIRDSGTPALASTLGGTATITDPSLTPLSSGGSTTLFSVTLPTDAACSGDTATDGYHVYSYLVPEGTEITSITFSTHPSVGYGFVNNTGIYFGPVNTAITTGQIISIPTNFEWAPLLSDGVSLTGSSTALLYSGTTGVWEAGLACAQSDGTLSDYWNTQVTFSASGADPNGFVWSAVPGVGGTTTTTGATSSTTSPTSTTSSTAPTTTTSSTTPTSTTTTSEPTTTTTTTPTTTTSSTSTTSTTTTSTTSTTVPATTTTTTPVSTTATTAPVTTTTVVGPRSPTALSSTLSGDGQSDGTIVVDSGTPVTDQATLSGTDVAHAGGTVTYTVLGLWSPPFWGPFGDSSWNNWFIVPVASGGRVKVTDGSVPASSAVTLGQGLYFWLASYSGDATNAPSSWLAGWATEDVLPPPCPTGFGWLSVACFARWQGGGADGQSTTAGGGGSGGGGQGGYGGDGGGGAVGQGGRRSGGGWEFR